MKKQETKIIEEKEFIESKSEDDKIEKKEKQKKNLKTEFIRFLKFLVFSCTAGIIQFGTFTLLNEVAHLSYWPSYLIALILSIVYNFTVNRKFTFKSANNIPIAMTLVLAYYAVFTPLSTLWGDVLTQKAHWNEYIVLAGTMVINFVTEFLWSRYVVFRKSIDTNKSKKKKNKTENLKEIQEENKTETNQQNQEEVKDH